MSTTYKLGQRVRVVADYSGLQLEIVGREATISHEYARALVLDLKPGFQYGYGVMIDGFPEEMFCLPEELAPLTEPPVIVSSWEEELEPA